MGNYLEQFKMFLIGQALEKYCGSYDPHNECLHFYDVKVRNSKDDIYDGYKKVISFNNKSGDKFKLQCQGALGDFSCDLFKLGTDTYDDAHVYVKTENRQGIPEMSHRNSQFTLFSKYDPYCHIFRNDLTWRYPAEGRDAFVAQCVADGENIKFPAYGVTSGTAKNPILKTSGQQDCIVIVIHDKKRRLTLLAHLLTSSNEPYHPHLPADIPCLSKEADMDMRSTCSARFHESEKYMAFFKNEYFKDTPPQDLEVTVITTQYTPASVTEKALKAIEKDFGSPKIEHKDCGDISLGGDMRISFGTRVDSRTGEIKTFLEWGY